MLTEKKHDSTEEADTDNALQDLCVILCQTAMTKFFAGETEAKLPDHTQTNQLF